MKDKKDNKRKKLPAANATTEKMVRSIANGNNVNAYKLLEQRMREKVSEKIDAALRDE